MGNIFLSALNESGTIQVITVNVTGDFGEYLANKSQSEGIVIPAEFQPELHDGTTGEHNRLWQSSVKHQRHR